MAERLLVLATLVFAVTGATFVGAAAAAEATPFLAGPGGFSLLTAGLLALRRRGRLVRALAVATGLYDLTVLVGQAYFAVLLWQLQASIFAGVAIAASVIGALIFIVLVPTLYLRLGEAPLPAPPDEMRRRSTRTSA